MDTPKGSQFIVLIWAFLEQLDQILSILSLEEVLDLLLWPKETFPFEPVFRVIFLDGTQLLLSLFLDCMLGILEQKWS